MELEAHRSELTVRCHRMTGSFQDAEDLVQETLLRAWNARYRYDPTRASVRTWLYRIATNACLTALDGRARHPCRPGSAPPATTPARRSPPPPTCRGCNPSPTAGTTWTPGPSCASPGSPPSNCCPPGSAPC
ncbi:sigma factor [Kitasatospora griseola]|uniref:sigma factor n=1 Tax=Kitasatospora griseola TaxID=2064 RepID=UPI00381D23A8